MGVWGALVVIATVGSAAPAAAPSSDEPKPLPADVDQAPETERAAHRDAGLRPVDFDPEAAHASAQRVISPDLRDPFLVARRDDDPPAAPRPRLHLHDDLRDPFARDDDGQDAAPPPADLRDPFDAGSPPCPATTDDGVKIQRPKTMRKPSCATPAAARAHPPTQLARR